MTLSTKPDFDRVKDMWRHFWAGEVKKRPLVVASTRKPGGQAADLSRHYYNAIKGNHEYQMGQLDIWVENTAFLAESVPYAGPDFGPDQFAAWLGTDLEFSEDSPTTNWAKTAIDDWDDFLPVRFDPKGKWFQGILDYSRKLARRGEGRYLVGMADLHSNMDAFLALRGSERLCMDFYDHPGKVAEAMAQVRGLYKPIYEALHEAGSMGGERGCIGWTPFWSDGKFATIQCDFLALLSPELSRRYVIPALEEEAAFLDHCVYHLDGPGCLPHLDDILSIRDIDVIQWVSGAGRKPMHEWTEVLRKCQAAGKGLQLYGIEDLETVKRISRELKPNGLVYCVGVKSEEECARITDWLERNT